MAIEVTKVYLLNVPLENDYTHTLYFASPQAQYNYFVGCLVKDSSGSTKPYYAEDFSYQRKDSRIRYPLSYDELLGVNYVMYYNEGSGKWYYAFVTKIEYVNEEMSYIYIETDVMQTWHFDYDVKTSFVEREHTDDDSVGFNTVPEGLETGEYVCNNVAELPSFKSDNCLVASTRDFNTGKKVMGFQYGGVPSGVGYYYMPWTEVAKIQEVVDKFEETSECIQGIYSCPDKKMFWVADPDYIEPDVNFPVLPSYHMDKRYEWNDSTIGAKDKPKKPTNLNGYIPTNKKLLTYPYTYMLMSNNAGSSAIYQYEHFYTGDSDECRFMIHVAVTPSFSIRMNPINYKLTSSSRDIENNEEGLNLGKLPVGSWNTDVFTNWLTQNSVNIGAGITAPLSNTAAGALTGMFMGGSMGGPAGAMLGAGAGLLSGLGQLLGTIGEVYAHSKEPPQARGNLNSGDVTYAMGKTTFTAYQMTIKREYARIIDSFFTAFGYRINRYKVPNKNHRTRFWFTKTIDAQIDGAIPMEDLRKIKDNFNKGITFWKDHANIGKYPIQEDDTYGVSAYDNDIVIV